MGKVPYLDGGLFQRHQIERLYGKEIQIEDAAFENLFAFFEQYQWHLDERLLRADNEINPDVLGYIFEKYINQKQMGAYYTKEDITGYISKNTIIPFLFDQAQKKCKIAFEGEQSVWRLLKEDPDRYIYDAVKKGVELDLPEEIAVGIKSVSKRTEWNKPASPEYALPTEIWREVVARRQRYKEVCYKMSKGEISSINDLITYNLDIRQFAQDVIENCEGTELLRAIYYTIAGRIPEKSNEQFQPGMSVLDPTCGSGAFLFAALNILEPLYEACLDRMQVFLDELESSGQKYRSDKFGDFRKILQRIEKHPNPRYFILKSIILNNLYGVDIMEEATEICKLRLFLKLVAQIDKVENIEPLPDIDFNIRAGNTLVGFASYDEVKETITTAKAGEQKQQKLMFGESIDAMARIEENAEIADRAFKKFRHMQTGFGMDSKSFSDAKVELSSRLNDLADELDCYLASEYGIDRNSIPSEKKYNREFIQWRESHQPFHWFSEFYGIINEGGFDVIIGNPPYVEYKKIKGQYLVKGYQTERCENLYAYVVERNYRLLFNKGRTGMIIPHSGICTDRMSALISLFNQKSSQIWLSTYCIRPAKLFVGVDQRLAIYLLERGELNNFVYSSNYHHWHEEFRIYLLQNIQYTNTSDLNFSNSIPKIHRQIERIVWSKLNKYSLLSRNFATGNPPYIIYFHNAPRYWIRAMNFAPYFWNEREGVHISTQVKSLHFFSELDAAVAASSLNSSLFYWWYIILSDSRHLNLREINNFPIGIDQMSKPLKNKLADLSDELMISLKLNAKRKECNYKTTGSVAYDEFYPKQSKPIVDEIDDALAKHYGFTDEELDFIINYDIKYRMGLG